MTTEKLQELLNKMRNLSITADESAKLGEYKTSLVEALKIDKVFDSFGNVELENLKVFFENGISYATFESDVAKFWFKGVYEEIKFTIQEKLESYDKVITDTYSDIFPKEYGHVGTTDDIYKIREDYWGKIKLLKDILTIQE